MAEVTAVRVASSLVSGPCPTLVVFNGTYRWVWRGQRIHLDHVVTVGLDALLQLAQEGKIPCIEFESEPESSRHRMKVFSRDQNSEVVYEMASPTYYALMQNLFESNTNQTLEDNDSVSPGVTRRQAESRSALITYAAGQMVEDSSSSGNSNPEIWASFVAHRFALSFKDRCAATCRSCHSFIALRERHIHQLREHLQGECPGAGGTLRLDVQEKLDKRLWTLAQKLVQASWSHLVSRSIALHRLNPNLCSRCGHALPTEELTPVAAGDRGAFNGRGGSSHSAQIVVCGNCRDVEMFLYLCEPRSHLLGIPRYLEAENTWRCYGCQTWTRWSLLAGPISMEPGRSSPTGRPGVRDPSHQRESSGPAVIVDDHTENPASHEGETLATFYARTNSVKDLENYLRSNPHKLNSRNNRGKTPLHAACDQGHLEVVELLLSFADVKLDIFDLYGETPYCIASRRNFTEILCALSLRICGPEC